VPRRRAILAVLAGLALTALAWASGALAPLERASYDARFAVRGERPAPEVAVVDLDARTLAAWGGWPVPRGVHARILDRLRLAGVRAVAYDVHLPGRTTRSEDHRLMDAIARAPRVVLATTDAVDGRHRVLGGDAVVRSLGARAGNALFETDPGGTLRRVPAAMGGLEAFSAVAARRALGTGFAPWTGTSRGAWIDFAGGPGSVRTVPAVDLLADPAAGEALRGRVVVVGSSAPRVGDVHPAPTADGRTMPGAEIEANAIATALRGYPLRSAPGPLGLLGVLAAAALGALAAGRRRWAAGAVLLAAAGWAVAVQSAFAHGVVLPLAAPLVALGTAALAARALRPSRRARVTRFVPDPVVARLQATAGRTATIPGDATVLCCRVRDLAALTATERAVERLDRALSAMGDGVLVHGGTLVTVTGDGITAVFSSAAHADAAVAAARDLLRGGGPGLVAGLSPRPEDAARLAARAIETGVPLLVAPVTVATLRDRAAASGPVAP
jgi:adenylate cyclase